jgi:lipoyl(octanoyl) transferase
MLHPDLVVERLGLVPYASAWQVQLRYHQEVAAEDRPPTLLLLEHPSTITLGRSTKSGSIPHDLDWYRLRGWAVHEVERGGDVTYHGPGQLVGYPIVPLTLKVGDFLRELEQLLLRVVARFGITARPSPGYAGLYAPHPAGYEAKLASIGIAVRQRVTFHGFALNVSTQLSDFEHIIPCGLNGVRMTSLEELCQPVPTMDHVMDNITAEACNTAPQG